MNVDDTANFDSTIGSAGRTASVAVVLTTFNDPDFLAEALTSIVAQQHRAQEIIVVDDGSDESPAPIVERFPGVVLVRERHGGLSSARNAGLRAARSEYIAFLDADDRLEPNAIAAGLACFRSHPEAVMVYGGHRRIGADGKRVSPDRYQALGADPYADFLRANIIGMHATVLYRRPVLVAAGGFDETLQRCEDYDLYLRLARDHPISSHPATVAEYRWHGGNMSRNTAEMLQAVLTVHDRYRNQTRARRTAWLAGRRNWKRWYTGGQQSLWDGSPASPVRTMRDRAFSIARRIVRAIRRPKTWVPPVGSIDFGDLGTTRPISLDFGWDRGAPIDRYYIEKFLGAHAHDIGGRVLEIGDDAYSRKFGAKNVARQDVLHVDPHNRQATLFGDLTRPGVLPDEAFDCIVLTQTLHLIFEADVAVTRLHAALKPGGILLLTVPGISQIDRQEWQNTWCWAFTPISIRRLFEAAFSPEALEIESHGNVFAAIAYLTGAVQEDVDTSKLDVRDAAYPVVVTMRAQKR